LTSLQLRWFIRSPMRRRAIPARGAFVLLVPPALFACGRSSAVPDDAPSWASETPSASLPGPAAAAPSITVGTGSVQVPVPSPPMAASSPSPGAGLLGGPCTPGRDSIACAADGVTVSTCAGGIWRLLELCRGPGHCRGIGSALTCDTGLPQPGDACVASTSDSQCRNAHEAIRCRGGRWMLSPCDPGKLCFRANGKGQAGCK
jgi:hypothetical protein